jgi:hypothetical protein
MLQCVRVEKTYSKLYLNNLNVILSSFITHLALYYDSLL